MALKAKDLREQSAEDLEVRERELVEQLFALRFQKVTGQLENPAKVREVRKDLARVLTVLRDMRESA